VRRRRPESIRYTRKDQVVAVRWDDGSVEELSGTATEADRLALEYDVPCRGMDDDCNVLWERPKRVPGDTLRRYGGPSREA
jgi:hypothetical protein